MKKKSIGNDFKELMLTDFVKNKAASHRECWAKRMNDQTKKQVRFDLGANHDDSLEIESAEEELNRKLTDKEIELLIKKFHSEVVRQHRSNSYA